MIYEAQQILARLDEIALKSNPLTDLDCVDQLIETEKQNCKPGYTKRLEYLQETRRYAEVMRLMTKKDAVAPHWLKDSIQRAKENLKHAYGFQYAHVPSSPLVAHAKQKSKWWPF